MAANLCPKCKNPLDIPRPAPERIRCASCGAVIRTTIVAQGPARSVPATVAIATGTKTAIIEKSDLIGPYSRSQPGIAENREITSEQAGILPLDKPATRRSLAGIAVVLGACVVLIGGGIGLGVWAVLRGGGMPPTTHANNSTDPPPVTPGDQPVTPNLKLTNPGAARTKDIKLREPNVQTAIDKGVAYLRQHSPARGKKVVHGNDAGLIALVGLAMLECDVKADDPDIKQMAAVIRQSVPVMDKTYAVAPAVLFLDRLHRGDAPPEDRKIIQTLGMRLIAGQTDRGIWGYDLDILDARAEERLLSQLRGNFGKKYIPTTKHGGDMSNTQFAALALWLARKYDLPTQLALTKAAAAVRKAQDPIAGTWGYNLTPGGYPDTATCVGLILLSLGRAVADEKEPGDFRDDAGVKKGIDHLAGIIKRDIVHNAWQTHLDVHLAGIIKRDIAVAGGKIKTQRRPIGARALGDLYFLWALERTALILGLNKFGDHDWHAWGNEVILQTQRQDGSWASGHAGLPDTSFALLFLVRANLFQDLTDKLEISAAGGIFEGLALAKND